MMNDTIGARLSGRDNNFTTVRILASTTVLFSHAWIVTTPGMVTADYMHLLGFTPGFHAVHVFFILSGFFLTKSILDSGDVVQFCVARVLRLMPAVVLSALVMAFVVGPWITTAKPLAYFTSGETLSFLFSIVTLVNISHPLPGVFENNVLPGEIYELLWTLRYEFVFCAALAAAFALGLLKFRFVVGAMVVVGLVGFAAYFWNGEDGVLFEPIRHLMRFAMSFGVGAVCYLYRDRIPHSPVVLGSLAVASFLLDGTGLAAALGILLLTYSVLYIGFAKVAWFKPLNWLGQGSYGIYVFGFPVLQLVYLFWPALGPWFNGAVAWMITVPLAVLSWHFFEKPLLAWKRPTSALLRRLGFFPPKTASNSEEPSNPNATIDPVPAKLP